MREGDIHVQQVSVTVQVLGNDGVWYTGSAIEATQCVTSAEMAVSRDDPIRRAREYACAEAADASLRSALGKEASVGKTPLAWPAFGNLNLLASEGHQRARKEIQALMDEKAAQHTGEFRREAVSTPLGGPKSYAAVEQQYLEEMLTGRIQRHVDGVRGRATSEGQSNVEQAKYERQMKVLAEAMREPGAVKALPDWTTQAEKAWEDSWAPAAEKVPEVAPKGDWGGLWGALTEEPSEIAPKSPEDSGGTQGKAMCLKCRSGDCRGAWGFSCER